MLFSELPVFKFFVALEHDLALYKLSETGWVVRAAFHNASEEEQVNRTFRLDPDSLVMEIDYPVSK